MSYDRGAIEQVCVQHQIPSRRCSESELELDFANEGVLVLVNINQGADTFLGFRDCPWHTQGALRLVTGDATHVEYAPEALVQALVAGEVLVVSQYVGGRVRNRWLTHRAEPLDLRYVEAGEELRVCPIAGPADVPNHRLSTPLPTSPEV